MKNEQYPVENFNNSRFDPLSIERERFRRIYRPYGPDSPILELTGLFNGQSPDEFRYIPNDDDLNSKTI